MSYTPILLKQHHIDIPKSDLTTFNNILKMRLHDQGDDGTKTRDVTHFLRCKPKSLPINWENVADNLKDLGFIVHVSNDQAAIFASHDTEVASHKINHMTKMLSSFAATKGWQYNGWESWVINDKPSDMISLIGATIH